MRIVIDLQGAQSIGSRNRGFGRYSMALALGIARNRGDHEVLIALNALFPDTIDPICAAFKGLLPRANIRLWSAAAPVFRLDPGNAWRREAGACLREDFLASLQPDVLLVTSLFEGFEDNIITSIGVACVANYTSCNTYSCTCRISSSCTDAIITSHPCASIPLQHLS